MQTNGDQIRTDTDDVRAGSTPHVTRWVLLFGLLGAIVLLTVIWVTGALVTGPSKSQNANERIRQEQSQNTGSATDSIVGDKADQMSAATPGQSTDPQNMSNQNAGK